MSSFNKVILMGNLTRDPDIKYTPKGTAICDIGLAINRTYSTDSGEKREEVTFVDVTLWGRVAEIIGEYCKKGRPLFVEGRLQLDTWDDKQSGQKRSKLKIIGENIQLLGGRDSDERSPAQRDTERPPARQQQRSQPPAGRPAPQRDPDLDMDGEPIPF